MTILNRILQGDLVNPATPFGVLFYLLLFLLIAGLVSRVLRLTVNKVLEEDKSGRIDRTAASFLTQLAQIIIYLLALIFYANLIPALRSLGTALLAGVSVASIVIGLAAQNTLGNLIAGISILLYRPFQVGDRMQVTAPTGLETGTVESLTLGYTILRTYDGRRIVVPNSAMAIQITVNLTAVDPRVMAIVPMSISYDSDIGKARQVLIELAQATPMVQEVISCPVTQVGDSKIVLSLQAWCRDPEAAKQVEFAIYEQSKKRFDQEGIKIP